MIQRRDKVGIIEFSSDEFSDDDEVRYCKHCLDYGFQVRLKNRIYPEAEPIPADHENWLQCYECGSIVAVHETEKESQIKDVVSTTDNPFDSGKDFLGIDLRKLRKRRQRKQEEYDYINDEDLKSELRKGSKLLSYSEQQPQTTQRQS